MPLLDSFVARTKLQSKLLVIVHIILKDERCARVRKADASGDTWGRRAKGSVVSTDSLGLGSRKSHRRYGIAHGWTSLFCFFLLPPPLLFFSLPLAQALASRRYRIDAKIYLDMSLDAIGAMARFVTMFIVVGSYGVWGLPQLPHSAGLPSRAPHRGMSSTSSPMLCSPSTSELAGEEYMLTCLLYGRKFVACTIRGFIHTCINFGTYVYL